VTEQAPEISFGTRIWLAYLCFFKILFDAVFANAVWRVHTGAPAALPAAPAREPSPAPAPPAAAPAPTPAPAPAPAPASANDAALQLLALLQREGRFLDFLEEDVTSFPDAEVGAAARVVHAGCRKAIREHAKLAPVRREQEGARVTVEAGTSPAEVKLVGNVAGAAPFHGKLVHRGWRVDEVSLPQAVTGHDARIVAPAEVEL
jgi:pyruvate/2-oxoglutarate dehydrogenase complex dihydrolipoamide acyltransferase (E2) component